MLGLTPGTGGLRLLPGLVLFGVGAGVVNPTMTVAALSTVDAAHSGMASGVNNTARQIGIAAGIAGLGSVLEARLSSGVATTLVSGGVPAPAASTAADLVASGDTAGASRALGAAGGALPGAYTTSFGHALTVVFLIGIGIVVLGGVVVVALIRSEAAPEPAAGAPSRVEGYVVVGDAEGRPTDAACGHLDQIKDVPPSTLDGCEDCLREGSQWVHLRKCLSCGHVGCCDNSPRRHATEHWHASSHPIVESFQPDEQWAWCYPDELLLSPVTR